MRAWPRFVVLVAVVMALPGCGARESAGDPLEPTRRVQSATGEQVEIPARPHRMLVDWITLDNLLALDVDLRTVAGAFGYGFFEKTPDLSPFLVKAASDAGIKAVGEAFEPQYEAVVSANPDVIILAADQTTDEVVSKLKAIAPVVTYAVPDGRRSFDDWRSSLKATAELLEQQPKAQAYIANYDRRIAQFRDEHPEIVDGLEVTVGKITSDKVSVSMYKRNLGTNVVDELGLTRPAAQRTTKVDRYQSFDVSLEKLDILDADIVFLEQRQREIGFVTGNPLWKRLRAVRTGRVHFVKNYWQTGGAGSAARVLDDAIAALTSR